MVSCSCGLSGDFLLCVSNLATTCCSFWWPNSVRCSWTTPNDSFGALECAAARPWSTVNGLGLKVVMGEERERKKWLKFGQWLVRRILNRDMERWLRKSNIFQLCWGRSLRWFKQFSYVDDNELLVKANEKTHELWVLAFRRQINREIRVRSRSVGRLWRVR